MPDLINCPQCGTPTSPSSNLCRRCGGELPDYLRGDTIKCPNCLEITSAVEETCRHCGKAIPEYLLAYHREEIAKKAEQARTEAATAPPPQEPELRKEQTDVRVPEQGSEPEAKKAQKPEGEQTEPAKSLSLVQPELWREQTALPPVAKQPEPQAEIAPLPVKTHPYLPLDRSMKLLVRRNQKTGMLRSTVTFALDVRVQLSPDMLALVKKYQMGKEVLYFMEKVAQDERENPYSSTDWRGVFREFQALSRTIAARALNVTITIDDLVKGKHIECKDILEMRAAEEQIKEACVTFKEVLESAAHFGGEEVIEI